MEGGKIKNKIIIILIIINLIFISGCIKHEEDKKEGMSEYVLNYELTIFNSNKVNFVINVPIPIGWEEFIDKINTEGNFSYKIIQTDFGDSLSISSNETVKITAYQMSKESLGFKNLSMVDALKGISNIFLQTNDLNENISILFKFSCNIEGYHKGEPYGTIDKYIIEGELNPGWNKLEILHGQGP